MIEQPRPATRQEHPYKQSSTFRGGRQTSQGDHQNPPGDQSQHRSATEQHQQQEQPPARPRMSESVDSGEQNQRAPRRRRRSSTAASGRPTASGRRSGEIAAPLRHVAAHYAAVLDRVERGELDVDAAERTLQVATVADADGYIWSMNADGLFERRFGSDGEPDVADPYDFAEGPQTSSSASTPQPGFDVALGAAVVGGPPQTPGGAANPIAPIAVEPPQTAGPSGPRRQPSRSQRRSASPNEPGAASNVISKLRSVAGSVLYSIGSGAGSLLSRLSRRGNGDSDERNGVSPLLIVAVVGVVALSLWYSRSEGADEVVQETTTTVQLDPDADPTVVAPSAASLSVDDVLDVVRRLTSGDVDSMSSVVLRDTDPNRALVDAATWRGLKSLGAVFEVSEFLYAGSEMSVDVVAMVSGTPRASASIDWVVDDGIWVVKSWPYIDAIRD